jgi:hypothetical protein
MYAKIPLATLHSIAKVIFPQGIDETVTTKLRKSFLMSAKEN